MQNCDARLLMLALPVPDLSKSLLELDVPFVFSKLFACLEPIANFCAAAFCVFANFS
jgi:hypothetical protein